MGASVALPFGTRAQQTPPTLGIMTPASSTTTQVVGAVVNAMKEFGWYENQNYRVLYRFADGHIDRIPALVDELVAQRVDVLVMIGEVGIEAAQRATKTIPTVGIAADMVRSGLAASMARPGGNLTGVNILASELDAKTTRDSSRGGSCREAGRPCRCLFAVPMLRLQATIQRA